MVLRKQNEIDKFIEFIDKEWSLSVNEETVLESVFNLFLAGKNTEIKKVEHLLNDETEELLASLSESAIIRYAENELDLISDQDEGSLVDALEDLNFKWSNKVDIEDFDDGEIAEEFYGRDLDRFCNNRYDIVTQSDLEEMTELFLNLSPQKRNEMINNLKNV